MSLEHLLDENKKLREELAALKSVGASSIKPLALLAEIMGGGGVIQITPNTPREVTRDDKTLNFKELWGRINIAADKAVFEFMEPSIKPLPTFKATILLMPVSGSISALEITDTTVSAVTSLGTYQVYP